MSVNVLVVDRNGTPVAPLTTAKVKRLHRELGGAGQCTIDLSLSEPFLTALKLGRHEVQVVDDDWGLVWWGVPVRRRISAAGTASIETVGLCWYFNRRTIRTTQSFAAVDQLDIAAQLVSYAQTGTRRSFGFTVAPYDLSGVTRTVAWHADERLTVGDALAALGGAEDGFDYSIATDLSGARVFTLHHPRRGQLRENIVLEWGRNLEGFDIVDDLTCPVNLLDVAGSGEAEARVFGTAEDTTSQADLDMVYDGFAKGPDTDDTALLTALALDHLATEAVADELPTLAVLDKPTGLVPSLQLGDTVRVKVRHTAVGLDGVERTIIDRDTYARIRSLELDLYARTAKVALSTAEAAA